MTTERMRRPVSGWVFLFSIFNLIPSLGFAEAPYSIPNTLWSGCHHTWAGNTPIQTCRMNYRAGNNPNTIYDVHLPPNFNPQARYPLLITVHGGSWAEAKLVNGNWTGSNLHDSFGCPVCFNPSQSYQAQTCTEEAFYQSDAQYCSGWETFVRSFAANGYMVANIEYTRSPHASIEGRPYCEDLPQSPPPTNCNYKYSQGIDDIHEFTRLVFDPGIAALFNIDNAKISITGISAGAHLALKEATSGRPYYSVAVRAAPIDLWDYVNNPSGNPAGSRGTVIEVFGSGQTELVTRSPAAAGLNTQNFFMEVSRQDNVVGARQTEVFAGQVNCSIPAEYNIGQGSGGHDIWKPMLTDFLQRMGPYGSHVVNTKNLNHAVSNSVLWDIQRLVDRDAVTLYSSFPGSRYNTEYYWIAAYFNSAASCSQTINSITLTARMSGAVPLGFPKSYHIFVTTPTNSAWVYVGTYTNQPATSGPNAGKVTITFPQSYSTRGIHLVPTELGTDNYNNYYLQLADISVN